MRLKANTGISQQGQGLLLEELLLARRVSSMYGAPWQTQPGYPPACQHHQLQVEQFLSQRRLQPCLGPLQQRCRRRRLRLGQQLPLPALYLRRCHRLPPAPLVSASR
jgi:hypothetical protein